MVKQVLSPQGNSQIERYNGTIWQTDRLSLSSKHLPLSSWEAVLPDALHSIRSLLCTATNAIYIHNHSRKVHESIVEEAELMEVNPQYAHVKLKSGYKTTEGVAPCPRKSSDLVVDIPNERNDDTYSAGETPTENEVDQSSQGERPFRRFRTFKHLTFRRDQLLCSSSVSALFHTSNTPSSNIIYK